MATIYKIELVSHFKDFTEKDLKDLIEEKLKERGNEITCRVERTCPKLSEISDRE